MWNSFKTGQVGFSTRAKPATPMPGVFNTQQAINNLKGLFTRTNIPAEYPTLAGRRVPPGS